MRATRIEAVGAAPVTVDAAVPQPAPGEVLIELAAAAVNPIDIAISRGAFYGGHPPLPYVPCVEGVGRVASTERLVYAFGSGLGLTRNGAASELFAAPEDVLVEVPEGADPGLAAALGVAGLAGWLPITWRAQVQPGEIVLVLGATGATGQVAVQAARHAGAARVVAAGRNPQRMEALAGLVDATVSLDGPDLAGRLQAACEPGADVIYDPLWGKPLEAALSAARPGARIVQLGQSAGAEAVLTSAAVRGKQLNLLGYSNFAVPREVAVEAYRTIVGLSSGGLLRLDFEAVPLAEADRAWAGQAAGTGKFVLVP